MAIDKRRPIFALCSTAALAVPIIYFCLLLLGGGSEGFGAWIDVSRLLVLIGVAGVTGLIFSFVSQYRGEHSVINAIVAIGHLILLGLLITALANA